MTLDTDDPPRLRDASDSIFPEDPGLKPGYVKSWAVLIGINDYKHAPRLYTAAADAVGMARVLIEQHGFLPDNVYLVVSTAEPLPGPLATWLASIQQRFGGFDQRATKQVIEKLLVKTLPSLTGPDDRLVIYFAGHGVGQLGSDSKPENAQPYLMPVEAAPSEWDEMIEIAAIARQSDRLPAKHALYIFDACFAGLTGRHRSAAEPPPPTYTSALLRRKARQCLTAGTGEQYVRDQGYDGHSLFTWHLLGLLKDNQLFSDHGVLGFTRLAAEIKERVASDSRWMSANEHQIPSTGTLPGHRNGEFVLSVHKVPPAVDELIATARQLVDQVGRCLDEPFPIAFAVRLWRRVLSDETATPAQRDVAQCELGRALLLLGDTEGALRELAADKLPGDADAMLLRAMAQLRKRRLDEAAEELTRLAASAADHPYAGWAACAAETARKPRGKRYALLIGVDQTHAQPSHHPAAIRDVEAMRHLLVTRLEFEPDAIQVVTGKAATRQGIAEAFQYHAMHVQPQDSFVCYFSGKGILYRGVSVYASYDTDVDAGIAWTEDDCDAAIRAIPAYDKLLITDSCHLAPSTLDERAGYRFLFGCRRDERGWDAVDADGRPRGAFTLALERAITVLGNASLERLASHAAAELAALQLPPQTPGYTGSGALPLIDRPQAWIELLELAQQSHRRFSVEQLDDFAGWLAKHHGMASMAPLWLAVGLARMAKQRHEAAIDALERSRAPGAWLPLVQSELCCGRYTAAFAHWRRWRREHEGAILDARSEAPIAQLERLLGQLCAGVRRALIVVTDADGDDKLLQHALRFRNALMKRWDMLSTHIKLVLNESRDAVIDAFRRFAAASRDAPALFLYIGPGFDGAQLWLSTTSDSEFVADLCLAELRQHAAQCANLTSAIVFTKISQPGGPTGPGHAEAATPEQATLGSGMLVAVPHTHRDIGGDPEVPPDLEQLGAALIAPGKTPFTLNDWRAGIDPPYGVSIRGNGDAPLLSFHAEGSQALALVRELDQVALHDLAMRLQRMTEHPELTEDARLQLAIVQLQLDRGDDALRQVDAAFKHHQASAADAPEAHDARRWLAEAHYWQGRILLRPDSYGIAEHNFALAVHHDPDHARAYRYRADAIRRLIETDLERTLQASLQHYIRLGAPLGVDDELWQPHTPPRAR